MLPKDIVLDELTHPKSFDELIDRLETTHRVEHERTTIEAIDLRPDGTVVTPAGEWRVTQDFLECAARAIGMPLSYAYNIRPELFCDNFASRRIDTTLPITVCRVGEVAVGLVLDKKSRYRPARTADVLRAIRNSCDLELRRATLSFKGVDVELVRKGTVVEPEVGDVLEVGIDLSNSESGGRQLKGSAYSHRLVCANGAIMADEVGLARWANDPRVSVQASLRAFVDSVTSLCSRLDIIGDLYRTAVGQRIPDAELWRLWRRVTYVLPRPLADSAVGLSEEQRRDLERSIKEREPQSPVLPTEQTVYDIHNRITHAAHGRDFYARRALQEIGGDLLSRAASWLPNFSAN